MTEAEFYARAQRDGSFRREQLEESAYQRKLAQCGFALILTVQIGYAAYSWCFAHRWPDFGLGLVPLLLAVWSFTQARTRIATLEALTPLVDATQPIAANPLHTHGQHSHR